MHIVGVENFKWMCETSVIRYSVRLFSRFDNTLTFRLLLSVISDNANSVICDSELLFVISLK